MKGALVFLIIFAIGLIITLGDPSIPPGIQIYDAIGAEDIDYPILGIPLTTLVPAVFNGIVYGVIVWVIYSIAAGRGKKTEIIRETVSVQTPYREQKAEPQEEEKKEKPYMSVPIKQIEGIGSIFAEKLAAVEIKTSKDLLEAGKTSNRREELAKQVGISSALILEWVNLADLMRINGVSEQYSDLLEEAGVDTVVELGRRNPQNLHTTLVKVNDDKKIVRRVPSASMVENWIEQAKKLPRKIEY